MSNSIRRGLVDGDDHVSVELLNYRKDGSVFWNDLAISPIKDESGRLIYYFASQEDVTERRRIEQMEAMERHLLMEVDHRALNALTLRREHRPPNPRGHHRQLLVGHSRAD